MTTQRRNLIRISCAIIITILSQCQSSQSFQKTAAFTHPNPWRSLAQERERDPQETTTPQILEKSITTTFEEGSGSYGNMFDVISHRDLTIVSLDIHTDMTGHVRVWTRPGSYEGYFNSSVGWELVANTTVTGRGRRTNTPIPEEDFTPIFLTKDSRQALYVTMPTPDLRYTPKDEMLNGDMYTENQDLELLLGAGVPSDTFGQKVVPKRLWNGILRYTVERREMNRLSTSFAGGVQNYGSVFEVRGLSTDVHITSLDLHLDSFSEVGVEVQIKSGVLDDTSYQWVTVCSTSITGEGRDGLTSIPYEAFSTVFVPVGHTVTFTVILTSMVGLGTEVEGEVGEEVHSNDDLTVYLGYGINEIPMEREGLVPKVLWNGILRYYLKDEIEACQSVKKMETLANDTQAQYFGFMFEVVAKEALTVDTMDIAHGNFAWFTVYTLQGSHNLTDFVEEDWIPIAEGQSDGSSSGQAKLIPPSLFTPVNINANATQSFYIALQSADLMLAPYNDTDPVIASNDDLEILHGRAVSAIGEIDSGQGYVWNGAVHYSIAMPCVVPTSSPTPAPTVLSTLAPTALVSTAPVASTTNVTYTYFIEYPIASSTTEIIDSVDASIEYTLRQSLNNELKQVASDNNVQFVDVSSSVMQSVECVQNGPETTCVKMESIAFVSHEDTLQKELMRFLLLQQAQHVMYGLPFIANYAGVEALSSNTVIILEGEDLEPLNNDDSTTFELILLEFLNEHADPAVQVTAVTTDVTQLNFAALARRLGNSQEISTFITGEFQPPPQVDFDNIVRDSIEFNSDELVSDLNKMDALKGVDGVSSRLLETKAPTQTPLLSSPPPLSTNSAPEEPGANKTAIYAVAGTLGVLAFLCMIMLILKNMQKSKQQAVALDDWSDNLKAHADQPRPSMTDSMMSMPISERTYNMMRMDP